MREPIAENRYTLTKALFSEGMGQVIRSGYGKTAGRGVLALLGAWLLMAVLTLLLKQSPAWLAAEAVVLGLAALWISVCIPKVKTGAAWKKLKGQYGDELERTTRFYADHLTVETAGREITVAYEDLARTLVTERLWILIARDKTGILVRRDSFRKGSMDGILQLLPPEVQ